MIGEISKAEAIAAVRDRRSCRTFTGEPLESDIRRVLEQYFTRSAADGFSLGPLVEGVPENVGTYGVIRKAACFIPVEAEPDNASALMRAAYAAEQAVLFLTARGYGSCWLGATFNFKQLEAAQGRKTVAAIALGKPAAREHLLSRITGKLAGSSKRLPFDVLFAVSADSDYREALELVRLAPSSLNKQPWRAVETAEGLHFFCTGTNIMNRLDMGIAFCHFLLAAPAGSWAKEERFASLRREHYVASYLRNGAGN